MEGKTNHDVFVEFLAKPEVRARLQERAGENIGATLDKFQELSSDPGFVPALMGAAALFLTIAGPLAAIFLAGQARELGELLHPKEEDDLEEAA